MRNSVDTSLPPSDQRWTKLSHSQPGLFHTGLASFQIISFWNSNCLPYMGSSFQTASHIICHITPPPSLSSSFCLHYICTPLTHPVFHSYPPSAFAPTCYKHLITLLLFFLPLPLYLSPPSFHQCLSRKRKMRLLTFEKILLGRTVPSAPRAWNSNE